MSKELVISAPAHERRVAILEEGQLVEIYIEREKEFALVGSIYKGRVTRVLPGMQSAFVDIGLDGDAFLYVSDVFENLEDYESGHLEAAPAPALPAAISGEPAGDAALAAAAGAEASEAEEPGDAQPHFEQEPPANAEADLPGEAEAQPQDNIGNYEQPPRQNFQPRHEGGRGDFRGGRGRGRGRGRWGGRGRGGRGHDRGRNLPPSKYASPQGPHDSRGYDSRGQDQRRGEAPRYSPPQEGGGEDAIVLPGESLAKYRGRTPATMLPPDEPAAQSSEPGPEITEAAAGAPVSESAAPAQPRSRRGLPSWLLADTGSESEVPAEETHEEAAAAEASGPVAGQVEAGEASAGTAPEEGDLTDEHVAALASQLAEAKHEETQEVAEAPRVGGGAIFEEENGEAAGETESEAEEAEEDAAEVAEALGESIHEGEETEEQEEEEQELAEIEASEEHAEQREEMLVAEGAAASPDELQPPAESAEGLLPGETRAPHGAPAEERRYDDRPRDSARVGRDSRSRFQRPYRGGRDRGRFGRRSGSDRGGDRGGRPRFGPRPQGGPRHSGHGFRGPQRRPQLISEMLKAGQDVIVQIAKEPLGKKGARITSHVALPGRFLVYMPTIDHIGVSRKIASADNRSRLRRLVGEAKGNYPGGFIVRTAAGGASDDEIRADIDFLGRTWSDIKHHAEERKAPALLHRDLNLVERILRDYVNEDYTAIWTDSEEEYGKIVEFMNRFQPKLVSRVKLYSKDTPIFEEFGIQHDLDKALRPKVWLKSGGYIVINHTEALVAIDVNTGKYVARAPRGSRTPSSRPTWKR